MKTTKLFAAFVAAVVFSVVQAPAQVTGSGTKGTIPVWVGTTKLGNSVIVQTGGNVGVGTNKPGAKLDVESASTTKPAVIGNSFVTKGNTTGVLGSAASPKGIGVQGYAATGGFFQTPSSTGIGVFGIATSTTGTGIGVLVLVMIRDMSGNKVTNCDTRARRDLYRLFQ